MGSLTAASSAARRLITAAFAFTLLLSGLVLMPGMQAIARADSNCEAGGWSDIHWQAGATNIKNGVFSSGAGYTTFVEWNWSVKNGSNAGDTFDLVLPAELKVYNSALPMKAYAPDGVTVVANGVWGADGKTVTFTLTDYADTHADISGSAWVKVGWDRSLVNEIVGEAQEFPNMEFGGCGTGSLPGHVNAGTAPTTPGTSPGINYVNTQKTGSWADKTQGTSSLKKQVNWNIQVGTELGYTGTELVVTDTVQPGWTPVCDSFTMTARTYQMVDEKWKAINVPLGDRATLECSATQIKIIVTGATPGGPAKPLGEGLFFGFKADLTPDFENFLPLSNTAAWEGISRSATLRQDGGADGVGTLSATVGNYVWFDENKDGRQDSSETPIAGVKLAVFNEDGTPVTVNYRNQPYTNTTTTDENGLYTFTGLTPGHAYIVKIVQDDPGTVAALAGLTPTQENAGDRDGDSSTWTATSVNLAKAGDKDLTLDFGFVKSVGAVSVGDYVWLDTNKDGIQDADESGISGVVLRVLDEDGNPVTVDYKGDPYTNTTTTDSDGKYSFDDLASGHQYTVEIVRDDPSTITALEGLEPTLPGIGDSATDSSSWTADSAQLPNSGDKDLTLDFGFVKSVGAVSVGDYVWLDTNKDGIQDADESGISGVVLAVFNEDGTPVTENYLGESYTNTTTTDSDGKYVFQGLTPGQKYTVTIVQDDPSTKDALKNYVPTKANTGDRDKDSDTWTSTSENLPEIGDQDMTLDFGFVEQTGGTGSIGLGIGLGLGSIGLGLGSLDSGSLDNPGGSLGTTVPGTPIEPGTPSTPGQPSTPGNPVEQPSTPGTTETPATPGNSVEQPTTPGATDTPAKPGTTGDRPHAIDGGGAGIGFNSATGFGLALVLLALGGIGAIVAVRRTR